MKATEEQKQTLIDKADQDERTKGVNVLLNIFYNQIYMADYMIGLVDRQLRTQGLELKHEEKRNWNMALEASKTLKARLERCAEPIIRGNGTFKFIQEDANMFMRFYCYLLDRTGGNIDDLAMEEIRLKRMPSQGVISQTLIDKFKVR